MTSTRLPKKVLLPLCGKTVLEVMLDRLSGYHDNIIIATTNDGSERPIVKLCEKLGVKHYRGDTEDVLSRYHDSAVVFGASEGDTIVRLTSDCPLIDEEVLRKTLNLYHDGGFDYVTSFPESFPRGLDVEVFDFKSLKNAYMNATKSHEKEHVTPYIISHAKNSGSYKDVEKNGKYRLTLDEEDDYIMIKEVYKKLGCRVDFSYQELIDVLHQNPYLYKINAHVEQKKV